MPTQAHSYDRAIAISATVLFWLLLASWAWADEAIVLPVVPVGISPVLTWIFSVTSSLLGVFIPLLVIWIKQYLGVQTIKAHSDMIAGSLTRGALLIDAAMTKQHLTLDQVGPGSAPMAEALDYVANARPDSIAATPQATDEHLTRALTAEIQQIQNNKTNTTVPSVILSPVSAVR